MSLDINKLLQIPDPVKDEIFLGFYKGELGVILHGDSPDKNMIGLAIALTASGGHPELAGMLSSKKPFSLHKSAPRTRKVFYISIGDRETTVKSATRRFLNDLTESQKEILQELFFVETMSPTISTEEITKTLFSISEERGTPDLVVINASDYININVEKEGFNNKLANGLLSFSIRTGSSILLLRELNEKTGPVKPPFEWRLYVDNTMALASPMKYTCFFWEGDKKYEESFVFENEKIKRVTKQFNRSIKKENYSKEQIDLLKQKLDLMKKLKDQLSAKRSADEGGSGKKNEERKEEEQTNKIVYVDSTTMQEVEQSMPTHIFVKSFKPYESGKNGFHDFKRITMNLPAGKKLPLITFSGGQKKLQEIRNKLDTKFPWFEKITTWIVQSLQGKLYFAEKSNRPVVISVPPILLVGPPGIGKTEWAATFAKYLNVPFDTFGFAGTSIGYANVSSFGRWWETPTPSRILSFVADCKVANPLLLLDEIDKQSQNRYAGTAQQALLAYFDRNATHLFDDFLEGYIDVSKLNMIMTANDMSKIDEPLLSRLEIIETPRPRPEHVPPILKNMRKRLAKEMNVDTEDIHISDKVVKTIEQGLTKEEDLRKIWQNMRAAFLEEITGTSVRMPNGTKKTIGF
jgi:hypothetical protein